MPTTPQCASDSSGHLLSNARLSRKRGGNPKMGALAG
jgi:hypothetical protein